MAVMSSFRARRKPTRTSFETFLDEHMDGLARYARVLAGNRDAAHDLLADSLIKAQNAWPKIVDMEFPLAYVRKILATTAISEKRKWSTRNIAPTFSGELPEVQTADQSAKVDRLDELQRLLVNLSQRQRSMVVMRYYLDLTDDEIADQLGCTSVTVRSTISRALGSLRITGTGGETGDAERGGVDRVAGETERASTHEEGRHHG